MRSPKMRNNGISAGKSRKNFFGGNPQNSFFPAGGAAQLQPAPKLPEFSVKHFVNGNFAFFDAHYDVNGPLPATGKLFISHGVHMKFPSTMSKDEQTTF